MVVVLIPSATSKLSAAAKDMLSDTCALPPLSSPSVSPLIKVMVSFPLGDVTTIVICGISPVSAASNSTENRVSSTDCVSGMRKTAWPTIVPPAASTRIVVSSARGLPFASPTKKTNVCASPAPTAKLAGWISLTTVGPLNRTRVCAVSSESSSPAVSAVTVTQPSSGNGSAVVKTTVARPDASVRADSSIPPPLVRKRTTVPERTGLEAASKTKVVIRLLSPE